MFHVLNKMTAFRHSNAKLIDILTNVNVLLVIHPVLPSQYALICVYNNKALDYWTKAIIVKCMYKVIPPIIGVQNSIFIGNTPSILI